MKDSKTLLHKTQEQLAASSQNTPTEAGQMASEQSDNRDAIIDAINRIFTEFELVYHNQYHKAFPDLEKLTYAKKLWLTNFQEYSAEQILHAAHQAIKASEYLPTVRGILKYCENDFELYGLPEVRNAYIEACTAPSPKSNAHWSHPAVYHAGVAADWFFLSNNAESKTYPIFETCYLKLCERVRKGEQLNPPSIQALSEKTEPRLSDKEQHNKLKNIRKDLKI